MATIAGLGTSPTVTFNPTDGLLYVASQSGPIYKVNPGTGATTTLSISGDWQINALVDITFDPDNGYLYVVESGGYPGTGNIYKVDPATGVSTRIYATVTGGTYAFLSGAAYSPTTGGLYVLNTSTYLTPINP